MTMLHIALATVAVLTATPALAQDAEDFAGAKAEATIGFDQIRFDLATASDGREKQADLGYGFTLGYDKALSSRLVAGVEAGVNLSDASYSYGNTTTGGELRKRREIVLAGRLGTPLSANALVYGKLGYANLQLRDDVTTTGVTTSGKRDLDGVLLGAGVEVKLSPRTYWTSEYRYTDYAQGLIGNKVTTGLGIRF